MPPPEKQLRYGKLPEIQHKFKVDPTSPPKIITLTFTAAVLVALPVLIATVSLEWMNADASSLLTKS